MEKRQKIKLDDIEKKGVFDVPDAYFETLPSKITDRLPSVQQKTSAFSVGWIKYSFSLAGVTILLLSGYLWFSTDSSTNEQLMTEVSNQEIVEYLQQTDVSSYDLMEAASGTGISMQDDLAEEALIDAELLIEEADNAALEDFI